MFLDGKRGLSEVLRVVPIINRTPTPATEMFVNQLEQELAKRGISAKLHTTEAGQADPSSLAIVVCNHDQENLQSCINEVASKQYCRIVFILLYVTSDHNLSDLRLKTKFEDYSIPETNINTFEILEMAYTTEKGIYKHELNDPAYTKIVESCRIHAISKRNQGEIGGNGDRKKMKHARTSGETKAINTVTKVHGSNDDDKVRVKKGDKYLYQVYIMDPDPTDPTRAFVDDLKEKLGVEYGITLTSISSLSEKQMEPDTFTIVICNNHSRTFCNITESLNKLKVEQYKRIIIVVLHVNRENALPTKSITSEIQDSNDREKYKDIVAFIDMAFTSTDTIYECEMNTAAFGELREILKVNRSTDKQEKETWETDSDRLSN